MKTTISVKPLVAGKSCTGRIVRTIPNEPGDYIYLTNRLTLRDRKATQNCKLIITEANGQDDHPAVIARTKGCGLIQLANATTLLHEGDQWSYDQQQRTIQSGIMHFNHDSDTLDLRLADELASRDSRIQVSIADEDDVHVARSVMEYAPRVDQFFLRGEFLWFQTGIDPYKFVQEHGIESTSHWLASQLGRILVAMPEGAKLNYRSLDMRSDESPEPGPVEANPQLGNHGIRRALREPEVLLAEIHALDLLTQDWPGRLIFSLPFLTNEAELHLVLRSLGQDLLQKIELGLFVETPAAVLQLSELLAQSIQRVYIGTKDLTQLVHGCDRGNAVVSSAYTPTSLAIQRLVRMVFAASDEYAVPAVLFASKQDLPSFLSIFPQHNRFSMCRGDYESLGRARESSARKLNSRACKSA